MPLTGEFPMRRLATTALFIAFTVACTVSADQFPDAYGTAVCNYYDRCEGMDTDIDECVDTISAWMTLLSNDECYVPAEGTRCVNSINALGCDEDTDTLCSEVFTGCSD